LYALLELLLGLGVVVGSIYFGEYLLHRRPRKPCPRCAGTGYLPQFKHVENGICFLCRGGLGRYTNPIIERQQRETRLKEKALQYEVELQRSRSAYLSERESHYRSLPENKLFELWSQRAELDLEQDEIELIRGILRQAKGISNTAKPALHVCADCGMVGSNCTCRKA